MLAGILGGAIGASLKKTDAASIAEKIERDFVVPGDNEADVFMPGAIHAPFDVEGAAKRAKEQGFTIEAFHGTRSEVEVLDPSKVRRERGGLLYVSQDRTEASKFAEQVGENAAVKSIFEEDNPAIRNADGSLNQSKLWKMRDDLSMFDISLPDEAFKSPAALRRAYEEYDLP